MLMLMPNDKLSGLLLNKESADSAAPPAPPPMQPAATQNNPYDFITNSPTKPKKSFLPGGNSLTSRLIIIGAGVMILFMIGLVVIALLNSGSTALKNDYSTVVLQQAELIRVSDIGVQKARQADAKNLAITTKLSLSSQQPDLLALAKKAGASTDPKILAASVNSETDTALTTADQANQFDEVFVEIMSAGLKKYQQSIKKVYDATSSAATKDTLSKNFNSINVLLGTTESKEE